MIKPTPPTDNPFSQSLGLQFLILLGVSSLFAEIIYQGAQSLIGPYLRYCSATGGIVGITCGTATALSLWTYSFFREHKSSNTNWIFLILGSILYLFSLPFLSFTSHWGLVVLLVLLNHFGRALRVSTRDIFLSHLHKKGIKFSFMMHTAIEQLGSVVGPLTVGFLIYLKNDFSNIFLALLIPAFISMLFLFSSQYSFSKIKSHFNQLEPSEEKIPLSRKKYNYFLIGMMLIGFGYIDFIFITFHFVKADNVPLIFIPLLYSITASIKATVGLIVGLSHQKKGIKDFIITCLFSTMAAPFLFQKSFLGLLLGIFFWSVGIAAQAHLLKSCITFTCSREERPWAYRHFYFYFGIAWLCGSGVMGIVYDYSPTGCIFISTGAQILAIPFLVYSQYYVKSENADSASSKA